MSNLSDLLPAGASAKQLTFTDSGSGIASKKPVILNSDGTVAEVAGTTTSAALADIQNLFAAGTANTSYNGICYATTEDRIVVVSANDHDAGTYLYPYYTIGTMSSGAITWTTPTILSSYQVDWVDLIYQSNTGRLVVCYHGQAAPDQNKVMCLIGTFGSSPYNTISWAGKTQAFSQTTAYFYNQLADWPGTDKFVIVTLYNDTGASYRGGMQIGTVGGASSLSFGSAANFTDGLITTYPSFMQLMYDTGITNQFIVVYQVFGGTPSVTSKALTVSGTTITDTTAQNISSGTTIISNCVSAAWDSDTGQALVLYGLTPTSATTAATSSFAVVSTASGSTTPNTPVAFVSGASSNQYAGHYWNALTYDSYRKVFTLLYFADDSTSYLTQVTVSGTTPTQGSNLAATGLLARRSGNATVFDPDSNLVVGVCTNGSDSNRVNSYVYTPSGSGSNLTAQAFVGVADSAISASAAGSIIVQGGTVTGPTADVTIAESLSSAFLYAQDGAGDPVGSKASATGSDNFLIAYEVNDGVARGALAQAATVTSGNISYGSSASIGGASTNVYHYSIAYDSTNDKFVVFWQNVSNGYVYGAVVTLTGNSISYGAETAVYSAAGVTNIGSFSSTYDPDTDRVILGVCDNSDNYAYSVVIKLGTTTIDTVGTAQKIDSASATAGYGKKLDLCYDTTEDKVIATYVYVGGGGSYYLRVAAGTVAGAASNSISWGSSSVVYSGDASYPSIAYNATDQRVVIVYKQIADGKGYSSVATVSGTTVTANTPSVMYDGAGTMYYTSLAHDSYMNKMVVYMRAYGGEVVNGAIDTSANSIAWSTPLNVSSDAYNPPQVVFNSSTNQTILSGAGTTKATAESYIYTVPGTISGQPLTIGTKYYVTSTGTFRSSADTPSVNAGLAISTTSLLLNGDS